MTRWNVLIKRGAIGWFDHSLWGKHTTFTDDDQERLEFMRLSCEPRIDTGGLLLEQFAKSAIPIVGDQLSMKVPARTVTVMLPNWSPQDSAYLVSQHQNFVTLGVEQVFSDPGKIVVKGGVGYLTFGTQNSMGDTEVTYWPNAFSDPTTFFKVTH
jgi:hypothetical protein